MKKIFIKNEKAVTLITLAVTVIILIILAGVSIYLALGNDGIIQKAKDSGDNYKKEETREAINLILSEWSVKRHQTTMTFDEFLDSKVAKRFFR